VIADQVSFTLFRFEHTAPRRLDLAGAWSGADRRDGAQPVLILHEPGGAHRLELVTGVLGNPRNWSAVFAWDGDPMTIERAELELGDGLRVNLPTSDFKRGRHRFERVQLPVVEPDRPAAPPHGTDVLAVHAAMVAAWEEAAEAQEEVARLRVDTERARGEARRERARREAESARLRESVTAVRRLAEEALQRERETAQQGSAQVEELRAELAAARHELRQAREDAERLRGKLTSVLSLVRDDLTAQPIGPSE
jgi:hypothetical protein